MNSTKKSTLPSWLVNLARKTKPIEGVSPSDADVDVAVAALAGLEPDELGKRFSKSFAELLPALRRVLAAVNAGEVPFRIEQECREALAELAPVKPHRRRQGRGGLANPPVPAASTDIVPTNYRIDPCYDPEDPDTLPEFLRRTKHHASKTLAPETLAALEHGVRARNPLAVNKALEFMYGTGRGGPLVAMQINSPGAPTPASRRHRFEEIINKAEEAEPEENRSESIIFNAELLGIQEEGAEADDE